MSYIALLSFVGVMVLHPYMPHPHEHTAAESRSFEYIHTGVVERGIASLLLLPICFLSFVIRSFIPRFSRALSQRGLQDVDIPLRLSLAFAFSKGVLHPKVY